MEILNQLIANNVQRAHEKAPEMFLKLIQVLRSAHYQDLERIWIQSKQKSAQRWGESHFKKEVKATHMTSTQLVFVVIFRQWVLDSIAAIGTPAALRFLKDRFLKKEITAAEMAQVMIASAHMVTVTNETMEIYKVCFYHTE